MRSKLIIGVMILAVGAMLFQGISGIFPSGNSNHTNSGQNIPAPVYFPDAPVPDFSSDSAFAFVKKQVDFGPRVPNTAAHKKCAEWLVATFKGYGLNVIEQKFTAPHYKGGTFDCVNIIAQYKPEAPRRVCIAAHWDSRFMADHDTRDTLQPIDGADDGASGVGVQLEIARLLAGTPPDIGVDLLLFDAEDQANDGGESETWCLASQYWAKNLHVANYQPYYALLLDMVGAKGARFMKEGVSMQVAPSVVERIWNLAISMGYGSYFVNTPGPGITDDHVFVMRHARIPMVDIISMPNDGEHPFGDYHHRHSDNMDIIDTNTLKAVGQVLSAVIWRGAAVQTQ